MANEQLDEKAIFNLARQIDAPDARRQYLDQVCGADNSLRERVHTLLQGYEEQASFLELPPVERLFPTLDQLVTEKPGTQIGPYKLLEPIGEGGMGVVYMAEQKEPVKRRVALKIIKPGMDTRQVIARFEAERQALAMMDHPNIAKVLDAGATESGRPYFVMELVNGLPVTKYCDERHLTPRERLELFVPICQAVQHAHQKGIIHRDIKPTNVLVAEYDDRTVPKIIDFGVAKAIEHRLTEKTMFTELGQVVGTPEYMSPEQAKLNQLDIDTRSDIYSLGVLLYELLVGETPFDRQRLRSAAFDELLRIIRDEEPRRPSIRLSRSEMLLSIATNRRIEPKKLSALVHGELDWIVMKAMEKDRTRRYETANGLANDIQRYLDDEQVEACPPSAAYRFKKCVRRNKMALAVTGLVLCFLVLLGSGVGWTLRDRQARQARVSEQVGLILDEIGRLQQEQKWPEALLAARRAEAVVEAGGASARIRKRVRRVLADVTFVQRLDEARQRKFAWDVTQFDHAAAAEAYAVAFRDNGLDLWDLSITEAVARLKLRPELRLPLTLALEDWAGSCIQIRDRAGAEKLMELADAIDSDPWRTRVRGVLRDQGAHSQRDSLLRQLAASAPVLDLPPSCFWQLASELRHRGYHEEGTDLLQRAQSAHPGDFWINFDLACFCQDDPRPTFADQAVTYYRVALAIRPGNTAVLNGLGVALRTEGRLDEAIDCHRRATASDPSNVAALNNLGNDFLDQGNLDEAIRHYRHAIVLAPECALIHCNLGEALRRQDRLDDAIQAFQTALTLDPKYAAAHNNIGLIFAERHQWDQAIEHYRHAVAIKPDYAIADVNIGVAFAEKGDWIAAIDWYRKAIALNRCLVPAYYNLGNALMKLRRLDEAMECWREAIRLDSTYVLAYNNLGVALAIRGNLDDAMECWTKSLQHDPTNLKTRQDLVQALLQQARTLFDSGDADKACDAAREVLVLTNETSDVQLQENQREAERILQESVDQVTRSSKQEEVKDAADAHEEKLRSTGAEFNERPLQRNNEGMTSQPAKTGR